MNMEYDDRGYGTTDKIVCCECIGDYFLKDLIIGMGDINECDYCDASNPCIELEVLMDPIIKGIYMEYENANNCMGYNSREGGFIGATTWDKYELISDEINSELEIEDGNILDDIINLIDDSITWCLRDPYGVRGHEEDYYTWKTFSNQLKYEMRYVFFEVPSKNNNIYEKYTKPSDILETIGTSIGKLDLIKTLNKNTSFFRARSHNKQEKINNSKELGSPPREKVKSNRMNPEGISMFYGALEDMTAITEVYNNSKFTITIGEYLNQKELNVIDLSRINDIKLPSLFDIDSYEIRMSLLFLKRFNKEITTKVNDDDYLEYIPTQVITEYFRHIFKFDDVKNIDGIIYTSSIRKNGKCIVLFYDNKDCSDEKDKVLWLNKDSIKKVNISDIKLEL